MEVEEVELIGHTPNSIEHQHVIRNRVFHRRVKAQRLRRTGDELGGRNRVCAGKERHFVPLPHELFSEPEDDALCAAVQTGRNTLDQRSDLGNFHTYASTAVPSAPAAPATPLRERYPPRTSGSARRRLDQGPRFRCGVVNLNLQLWKSAEQIFSGLIGRAVIAVLGLQMAIDNQREAGAWSNVSTLDVSWLHSFVIAQHKRLCHSDVPWA